jgi:hypothetical protein
MALSVVSQALQLAESIESFELAPFEKYRLVQEINKRFVNRQDLSAQVKV